MHLDQIPMMFISGMLGTARMMSSLIHLATNGKRDVLVEAGGGLVYFNFRSDGIEDMLERPLGLDDPAYHQHYMRLFDDFFSPTSPGVIVIGENDPAHAEIQAVRAARLLPRPRFSPLMVVQVQDFWNGHARMFTSGDAIEVCGSTDFRFGVAPDLLITTDMCANELARKDERMGVSRVCVAGHPQVRFVELSIDVMDQFNALRREMDRVIYYAGSGESTDEEMRLLAACVRKTPGPTHVVLGFHPKMTQFHERWERLAAELFERFYIAKPGTGDEWARLTTVVSGYSTLLVTAAAHGQLAISLDTDETRRTLYTKVQLERYPCAHGYVREPICLFDVKHSKIEFLPYDCSKAWEEIEDMVVNMHPTVEFA